MNKIKKLVFLKISNFQHIKIEIQEKSIIFFSLTFFSFSHLETTFNLILKENVGKAVHNFKI